MAEGWELARFNDLPAIELSCRLNINPDFYEVAFLDLAIYNKRLNIYAVFENKTTGSRLNDITPMYKNSSQTIGYSICLDTISGQRLANFGTFTFVAQQKSKDITNLEYHVIYTKRTLLDRLHWFFTLGYDVERIQRLMKMNFFPMRGSNCLAFNKTCPHFGTCQLRKTDVPKEPDPDPNVYQFEFFLDDLVKEHIEAAQALLIAKT